MSFSIDESKIDELLRTSKKGYEMSSSDLPPIVQSENYGGGLYYVVSGTIFATRTLVTEETRQHMMALRRRIEESGIPLKNAEELSREIEDMRSRS